MESASGRVTAIILAGERPGRSELVIAGGVACKALLPVGGRAMVTRVIEALLGSDRIQRVLLCGPNEASMAEPRMAAIARLERVSWLAPASSPAASAVKALEAVGGAEPVLVTTSDHALLRREVVDHFLRGAQESGAALVAGVADREVVRRGFPELRKTTLRLKDRGYCGCNLFYMKSEEARRGVEFWRRLEAERKRPWKMAQIIGFRFLLRYLARRMSLAEALAAIGKRMGVRVDAVLLPFAEAAVDIDSVEDWKILESRLSRSAT